MRKILFILSLGISTNCFSQKNNFIGLWQEIIQDTNCYCLITDKIYYSIYDYQDSVELSIDEQYYGFIEEREIENLSIEQLKDCGNYFVTAHTTLNQNEVYDVSYFLIYGTDVQCKTDDFSSFELEGPKFFKFVNIERFNKTIEALLKNKYPHIYAEYLELIKKE